MKRSGRGARPCRHASDAGHASEGTRVLTHPMRWGEPLTAGMRSRAVGTRVRREAAPYGQEANVTDAARVRRSCRT